MTLTPADLLTGAGAISAVLLVIQFLVKPFFKAHPVPENVYPFALNLCALVIALLVEGLGLLVVDTVTRAGVAQAIIVAFFAAFSAIGIYESQNNTKTLANMK